MTEYRVRDDGAKHRYYSEIPHMIDDANLTPYAFRLYVHLKRVAGDEGLCWQSTETLAKACHMGFSSVSKAKQELVDNNLIEITGVKRPQGGKPAHNITIIDVWSANEDKYAKAITPQEIKNTLIKNKSNKNKERSRKRDTRLDHPAIVEYKEIARLHVPIAWRDAVIETVGDNDEAWGKIVLGWIGHGWNPRNVKGMLDAYKNGGIKSKPRPAATSDTDALLDRVFNDTQ